MGEISVRLMTQADIPQVSALERDAFVGEGVTTPFARELANKLATYLVACCEKDVVGYAGLWFIVDEAHLTSIAVREEQRRRGIGERLLRASLELALERQATMMTLEVRASNQAAQALYEKYGFRKVGIRKGYYSDNHEDAWLMTVEEIDDPAFQEKFIQ